MEKTAETRYPVHPLISRRWSPRAFAPTPVEPDKLRQIMEATRWAASSYNEQPWRYLIATQDDPGHYETMLSCLLEMNQSWARQAPVLLISFAKRHFTRSGADNRVALHDVGAASTTLALEALELGLFVHQMGGIDHDKIVQVYGVPEEFVPVAALALGYPGDAETLPEKWRDAEHAPRSRKPLEELIFARGWEQTAPLVAEEMPQ